MDRLTVSRRTFGVQGRILEVFESKIMPDLDVVSLLEKYNAVYRTEQAIPEIFAERIWPLFEVARRKIECITSSIPVRGK